MPDNTLRKNIYPGLPVVIVLKEDQKTGKGTQGFVKDILTNISIHPRGIKVRLETGEVGRVQYILDHEV
jgi:uncharacterized repeat protein (TIGR03833 family)